MIHYTVDEIIRITEGAATASMIRGDYPVSNIITDSRTLLAVENAVFFALKGERNDGHLFIEEVARRGVKVFVVSRKVELPVQEKYVFIRVDDPLEALQKLAAFHRTRFNIPVVGITGSNGKTVIKEWLNDLLEDNFSVVRSPRSYNSQIGAPLSVWLLQPGDTLAIFEAGISRPGEMQKLEEIIQPTLGIITNLGDAHQENFGTAREKAVEKLLLFKRSEKLICCADHPEISEALAEICTGAGPSVIRWTLGDRRAEFVFRTKPENNGTRISVRREGVESSFFIPMTDASSIENCCHCFVAAVTLGVSANQLKKKFQKLAPLAMRLEIKRGINGSLLLNDFYNSDINSLEIALAVLNSQAEKNHLEKIVILSDIRQSGLPHPELYGRVNKLLTGANAGRIIGVGREISKAEALFTLRKDFFPTTGELIRNIGSLHLSQAAILMKGAREFRFEEISERLQQQMHQTVLEINLNALVENLNIFRSLLKPDTRVMVMVKAFSYGSGDTEIAKILQFHRADYLAVAVADEGKELRQAGITLPVVVMNPEHHSFQQMIDYYLEPNLYSVQLAEEFIRAVDLNALLHYPVHLKIDTGMNRLGIKTDEEIGEMIRLCKESPQIRVKSVFSHLAASEDPQMDRFTLSQIGRFRECCDGIIRSLGYPVMRHILNSAGIERFGDFQFEMVRLGIGLYGISSTGLPLKPVSKLKSCLSQIKMVDAGETVGYNRSGKIGRLSKIGIVPVGYADGLDRRLGNTRGKVYVNGHPAPITGNICMDMCMIDVTGIECKVGDEVEIFGQNINVAETAVAAGTIPYEILTGISQRVKRIYIQE